MSTTLTFTDETSSGTKLHSFTLECLTERMTVREIIRARIYEEVRDFNLKTSGVFQGLIAPTNAERSLNGYKLKTQRRIDWEKQYAQALLAFESNGFFMLIGNRQAESLDDVFEIKVDTEVSFVKLVPLVGG